MNNSFCIFN